MTTKTLTLHAFRSEPFIELLCEQTGRPASDFPEQGTFVSLCDDGAVHTTYEWLRVDGEHVAYFDHNTSGWLIDVNPDPWSDISVQVTDGISSVLGWRS